MLLLISGQAQQIHERPIRDPPHCSLTVARAARRHYKHDHFKASVTLRIPTLLAYSRTSKGRSNG